MLAMTTAAASGAYEDGDVPPLQDFLITYEAAEEEEG